MKKVKEILFGKYKYQRKSDDEKLSIEIEIAWITYHCANRSTYSYVEVFLVQLKLNRLN